MVTDRDEHLIDEALSLAIAVLRLLPEDARLEENIADMARLLAARQRAGMRVLLEDIAVQRVASLLVAGMGESCPTLLPPRAAPVHADLHDHRTALLSARRAPVRDDQADPAGPAGQERRLEGMTAAELAAERARLEHRLRWTGDEATRRDLATVTEARRRRGLLGPARRSGG